MLHASCIYKTDIVGKALLLCELCLLGHKIVPHMFGIFWPSPVGLDPFI